MLTPTYPEFIRQTQALALRDINDERKRMAKAEKLWLAFKSAMRLLGLHPLTGEEILSRRLELDRMERDVPGTHCDGPTMRFAYKRHTGKEAPVTAEASL